MRARVAPRPRRATRAHGTRSPARAPAVARRDLVAAPVPPPRRSETGPGPRALPRRPAPTLRPVPLAPSRRRRGPPRSGTPSLAQVPVLALAARLPVPSIGDEIVAGRVLAAGPDIDVRMAPRVERDRLLEVRPAPVGGRGLAHRSRAQGFDALRGRRIVVVVETILGERQAEQLRSEERRVGKESRSRGAAR